MMEATITPEEAFQRYEAIRTRLPQISTAGKATAINDLLEVADHFDAFVFDAYGVLNVGDRPVKGARARLDSLRAAGKKILVLTNAASFTRTQTQEKFQNLGFDFAPDEIVSSREICERYIAPNGIWGVMAPDGFESRDLDVSALVLEDDAEAYGKVAGFLLLSSAQWTPHRQAMLTASLVQHPRPIFVANPDLVAPRETGLSLEPGYFAQDLQDKLGCIAKFHGKPFPSVYDEIEYRLDSIAPSRIAMIGDTLHTDVLGAQSRGWGSVLITDHGLFSGMDVMPFIEKSGIVPDWIAPTI